MGPITFCNEPSLHTVDGKIKINKQKRNNHDGSHTPEKYTLETLVNN